MASVSGFPPLRFGGPSEHLSTVLTLKYAVGWIQSLTHTTSDLVEQIQHQHS